MSGPQVLFEYAKAGAASAAVVWASDQGARAIVETPRGVHWMHRDLLGAPGPDVVELLVKAIEREFRGIRVTVLRAPEHIRWARRIMIYLVCRITPSKFVAWAERYLEVPRVLDALGEKDTPASGWGTLGYLVHTGSGRWELRARGEGTGQPFAGPTPPALWHTLWIAAGLLHEQDPVPVGSG